MKAVFKISLVALLALGSCTSGLYTGVEYDDLYYSASDKPLVSSRQSAKDRIVSEKLNSDEYYDNIYAADTLVSDEYSDAVDYDNQIIENNSYNNGYEYYNDYSYSCAK